MATLRTRHLFNDSRLTLIAVESVDFRRGTTSTSCQLYGQIEPIAVVVCSADRAYALDMEAKPADLDELRQAIPELDAAIAPVANARG
jgi:uncharacterized spore protein YtfJ